jgi:uncharacterized protein (DUF849 family)
MGVLDSPVWKQFILGVAGGAPASTQALCQLLSLAAEGDWQVAALGENGPWRLLAASLSMGGHVRIGLQDTLCLPNGEAVDGNAALVDAAAVLCRAAGASVASVDDARELLSL